MDNILNPTFLDRLSSGIVSHGVNAHSHIIGHYGHECKGKLRTFPPLINSECMEQDFIEFKSLLKSLPDKSLQAVWKYLLTAPLQDIQLIYPDFGTIAGIMMT